MKRPSCFGTKVHWCQTVVRWMLPSPPPSDSSRTGVLILLCWVVKRIIAVFCQKLRANQ